MDTSSNKIFYCNCEGRNPNCSRCGGKGVVETAAESTFVEADSWKKIQSKKPKDGSHLLRDLNVPFIKVCPLCSKSYKTRNGLMKHLKEIHMYTNAPEQLSDSLNKIFGKLDSTYNHYPATATFECRKCSKRFPNFVRLIQHIELCYQMSRRSKSKCPFCKKIFTSIHAATQHLSQKHFVELSKIYHKNT